MARPIKKVTEVYTKNQVVFMNNIRKLWQQNVSWTRAFMISACAELNDLPRVTKRLIQNPKDFSKALRPFYGAQKAEEFERLLEKHLVILAKFVNDAKAGKMSMLKQDSKKLYDNADSIAKFLAGINPAWSEHEWQTLLYENLKMTENELTERLNGQFEAEIMQYDTIEVQALIIADLMAKGIIKQASYR